jgi:hypothetical protein
VNNVGVPMWYTAPHIGVDHDLRIARDYQPPFVPSEKYLTDAAYCCRDGPAHLLVPYKKLRGERRVTGRRRAHNRVSDTSHHLHSAHYVGLL